MTLSQVRHAGLKALQRELGPVDFVRFLQHYETGSGDYTAEREMWLGKLDEGAFLASIRAKQAEG